MVRPAAPARAGPQPGARGEQTQADQHALPVQAAQQPPREGDAEDEQDEQGQQSLEPFDHLVHRGVVLVLPLRGPEGQRAHEDREEAVAAGQLPNAVRRHQGGDGEQRLSPLGDAQRVLARAERHSRQQPADGDADQHADRDLAHGVPGQPLPPPAGDRALAGQQDGRHHEREGQPVVEPRFGGECEADLVLLAGLPVPRGRRAHLDVGGQHRVGRRQHRAQQECGRGGEPGQPAQSATAAMDTGIATARSRQVADQLAQVSRRRRTRGRSRARPTPISATITVSSVTCSIVSRLACGSRGRPSGSGVRPSTSPTPTSTIGADSAHRLSRSGSTTARSRVSPTTT